MEQHEKQQQSEFDDANLLDIKKATVSFLDAVGFFVFKIGKYVASKWVYLLLGLLLGGGLGYVKYNKHQKMLQTAEFSPTNGKRNTQFYLHPTIIVLII